MSGRRGEVAGVVLAAGLSRRLGYNKLLAEIDGEPLVRRSAARALDAGLDPVLVVVGHERERVEAALRGLACRAVFNPRYAEEGRDRSVEVGLRAVPPEATGAMVILADMPRVEAWMMRSLLEAYRAGSAPLVASRYGSVSAPPMVFDRVLFPALLAATDEGGGRRVVQANLDEADVLFWPESALRDLDVPDDASALGARRPHPRPTNSSR